MNADYVHGYDARETRRLADQAETLADLLHHDTTYPPDSRVLEVGCGVGAQTLLLANRSPQARFVAVDISAASIDVARRRIAAAGLQNVEFIEADIRSSLFAAESFDHVFVCFVLEHLAAPLQLLRELRRLLRPHGTLTAIEGDHGSTLFHPESAAARDAIDALVTLQARAGGDALIGRRLFPLLTEAGFARPHMVDGLTRKTFIAMVSGVRTAAIDGQLISAQRFDQGIRDLERTSVGDGVFCYTFFKAVAANPCMSPSDMQH
jgi:SAM-dependent methyltransferase